MLKTFLSTIGRASTAALLAAGLLLSGGAGAAVITAGTPTTTVPGSLFDPLSSLDSLDFPLLPNGLYLLPIEIAGANGLQSWSFDLLFDPNVVTPIDVGGLYQSVYQAEFSAADPTRSDITSSGLLLPDSLLGIAGFSYGVSGDGLLAYVLFELAPEEQIENAGFGIDNPTIVQQVPAPATIVLLAGALPLLLRLRRGSGAAVVTARP